MNKKTKIILLCIILIVLIPIIFFIVDYNRVSNNNEPLLCLQIKTYEDGGTKEYLGLGYKIIAFNTINGYNKVKIGSIFMKYDDFENEIGKYEYMQILNKVDAQILELVKENEFNR